MSQTFAKIGCVAEQGQANLRESCGDCHVGRQEAELEVWQHAHSGRELIGDERWQVITEAAEEVGPALFFSLLIVTLLFIPVFTLKAQEGRLFGPLAFTKTYAIAAAEGLSVTLIPVLMGCPGWLQQQAAEGLCRRQRR